MGKEVRLEENTFVDVDFWLKQNLHMNLSIIVSTYCLYTGMF